MREQNWWHVTTIAFTATSWQQIGLTQPPDIAQSLKESVPMNLLPLDGSPRPSRRANVVVAGAGSGIGRAFAWDYACSRGRVVGTVPSVRQNQHRRQLPHTGANLQALNQLDERTGASAELLARGTINANGPRTVARLTSNRREDLMALQTGSACHVYPCSRFD
jgi:hypothetical protein